MIYRFTAFFALLLLTACSSTIQDIPGLENASDDEIGYVTRDQVVLFRSPVLSALLDEKRYPGVWAASSGLKSLTLANNNNFSNNRIRAKPFGRIGKFKDRQVTLPIPENSGCLTVWNDRHVVALRNQAGGKGRYGFFNPYERQRQKIRAAQNSLKKTRADIQSHQSVIRSLEQAQSQSVSYTNGQCIRPPMGAIPPKPRNWLSDNDIALHSVGFCMELLSVRYNRLDVYEMLASSGLTELTQYHKLWKGMGGINVAPRCALQMRPRLVDGLYTMFGNIGAKLFGAMGRAAAISEALSSCAKDVKNACDAQQSVYTNEVARIKNAPNVHLGNCKNSIVHIERSKKNIAQAQDKIKRYEAEIIEQQRKYDAMPERVLISEARCI